MGGNELSADDVRRFFDAIHEIEQCWIPEARSLASRVIKMSRSKSRELAALLPRTSVALNLGESISRFRDCLKSVEGVAPQILTILRRERAKSNSGSVSIDGYSYPSWGEGTISRSRGITGPPGVRQLAKAALDEQYSGTVNVLKVAAEAARAVLRIPSEGTERTPPDVIVAGQQLEETMVVALNSVPGKTPLPLRLDQTDRRILRELLGQHPRRLKTPDIGKALNRPHKNLSKNLSKLKGLGLLDNPGRQGYKLSAEGLAIAETVKKDWGTRRQPAQS